MDMDLNGYLKELNEATQAMMAVTKETPQAIKDVVYNNFWQKQSAFCYKVKREFGGNSLEESCK